jgi:hypothetical protein
MMATTIINAAICSQKLLAKPLCCLVGVSILDHLPFMWCRMVDIGAHHSCWLLLQALFMIAEMADRIQGRALDRCGELLHQYPDRGVKEEISAVIFISVLAMPGRFDHPGG